ncbi:DegT/DnrJ/EryC1/StrS family aminotransferase [Elusimicrobiota bacterium]
MLGFEEEFAEFCGTKYAVGVCSGTSALHLALEAVGCRGKQVITTPLTFIATCEAVNQAGGKIKWVDVHPEYYTIDPGQIKDSDLAESEVLLPVHLYGHPADMGSIMGAAERHNVKVIEDCAQSHGAEFKSRKTGTFGKAGCFSFYPGKNLGAYGDAGCVVCDDKETVDLIRRLRTHGSTDKYLHTELGYNYRMDALQAAVLRVKLKYLNEWNEARREKAELYNEALKDLPVSTPKVCENMTHVFHQYVIIASQRDELKAKLNEDGISTAVHYPVPLHLQPSFSFMGYKKGDFPVAERVTKSCLSLPMYPELKASQIEYISDKIKEFYE